MYTTKEKNLQDAFLNETVFLMNGFQMKGTIAGFDGFTVSLLCEGREQLIYKHAISTVSPARRLELRELEARESIEI
jgi:host factor-I protein